MRPLIYVPPSLVLFGVALFVFISRLLAFIQIFFQHAGSVITQYEIAVAHTANELELRPQLIPKIIHHIFHDWRNESIPADWQETRQTCIDTNNDWKFLMWTEKTSREFLGAEFPWFLDTYNGYPYPVQRVDTLKYFLMLHFGGIYLDMDNGCLANLTPFLYYPTWTTDGGRGALSNNILGSAPNHPFWHFLTDSLIPYNYDYIFPYITISYASGQWFETTIWDAYHATLPKASPGLYRIMMDDRPGTPPWIYFTQTRGGSWRNWDNVIFLWIGDNMIFLAFCVGGLFALVWWAGMRCRARSRKRRWQAENRTS